MVRVRARHVLWCLSLLLSFLVLVLPFHPLSLPLPLSFLFDASLSLVPFFLPSFPFLPCPLPFHFFPCPFLSISFLSLPFPSFPPSTRDHTHTHTHTQRERERERERDRTHTQTVCTQEQEKKEKKRERTCTTRVR
jgi:hypothetical protein